MLKTLVSRTGVLVAATALAALALPGSAQAAKGASYVGYGQTNNWTAVWCVQKNINSAIMWYGLDYELLTADGSFGPKTDQAVRYMQNAWLGAGEVDGIVGPKTGDMILEAGKAYLDTCNRYIPTTY
ncbi:peptidoglycan-binding protein [Streptomyces sp. NBC_00250]|uniref:peptidoglycan-binding domain-containing protein n=1 Tax=Streptomyces sp. NBC_00250 TaxID=2903641 RepID=UPI002E28E046|nr:peptidoglycan-binding domain-containing protein [Streptomyces sp. NBC_00250]